mmetsp:Transcript_18824/g.34052  ORF Transcript_18824/g.34052 Transcript_18824/m.34052 type:complete len:150 (-) Transcript_18824:41-490(-)
MISAVSRIVAAVIAAVSFVTPVSRDTERRETLTRIDQTREFRECKEILATNNTLSKHLTRDNFVSLLQKVSPEGVKFRCENLPLGRLLVLLLQYARLSKRQRLHWQSSKHFDIKLRGTRLVLFHPSFHVGTVAEHAPAMRKEDVELARS